MTHLADLPIQHKLRFAMLLTSMVALLLTCTVFIGFEYYAFRRTLERNVDTIARITADNSTAALAFGDADRARQTLDALAAESQIVRAVLFDARGAALASFATRNGPPPLDFTPAFPPLEPIWRGGYVVVAQPVVEGDRRLGTLFVQATMDQIIARMGVYAIVALAALALAFWVVWLLTSRLQRSIARPVLELANTARAVSAGGDFSLRAPTYGSDEIGELGAALNLMLERTQEAVTALRESEARFRHMADGAPVLIWLADETQAMSWVNERWIAFVGRALEREVPSGWQENIHPDDRQHVLRLFDDAFSDRRPFQVEFRMRRHDDVYRWVVNHGIPRTNARGEFSGFIGSCIDVTERREAQDEVERARDEALAASLAKDHFLAALSHELRTPLNPVLLLASDGATDQTLSDEIRDNFELIRQNVALEARLIDDLLDLTRIARGKIKLNWSVLNPQEILLQAVDIIGPDFTDKHIEVRIRLTDETVQANGDATRLQQVFWNILKNASKFTPEGGAVTITSDLDHPNSQLWIRITDSGIGLSPDEAKHIFDAFAQGDHAAEGGSHRFGGLGLGLAIARSLLEMHGGGIRAESPGRGRGSTFIVTLPVIGTKSTASEYQLPLGETPTATTGTPSRSPAPLFRLLLVEDHAPTRTTLDRLLRRRNYDVTSAGTLAEARKLAAGNTFDLLISDLGLPDGNGCTLMAELRHDHPRIQGVALSGYGMDVDRERTRSAGFAEHLTKPVDVATLDMVIARLARPT